MSIVKDPLKKNIKRSRHVQGLAEMPSFLNIVFDNENISFHLSDKRIITIPLNWIPKLENASTAIRENYILRGHFAFWDDVDEIVGVKNLLNGTIVPR